MNKMWFIYISTIFLVIRAIVFEKYTQFVAVVWFGFFGLIFLMFMSLHWSFLVGIIIVSLVGYPPLNKASIGWKYLLICKGDYVEYAPLDTSETLETAALFKTVKVLRYLKQDEVKVSGGFEREYLEFYEHFYLCEDKNKNIFIPYEWILRIETEYKAEGG